MQLSRACGRSFRRPGDLKRHKCRVEREKPIEKQKVSVQCSRCKRWMRSKGGLAVHKCRPEHQPRSDNFFLLPLPLIREGDVRNSLVVVDNDKVCMCVSFVLFPPSGGCSVLLPPVLSCVFCGVSLAHRRRRRTPCREQEPFINIRGHLQTNA